MMGHVIKCLIEMKIVDKNEIITMIDSFCDENINELMLAKEDVEAVFHRFLHCLP